MRWNSVKKTAQWAVFRNSPEGFSLRGRGARSAARNPGGPAIVLNAVLRTAFFIAAAKPSCTPYCLSAFGLRAERYAAPLLQGNMGHLAASRCLACESGIWIILLLSLFKKFLQKLGNVLDGAREFL